MEKSSYGEHARLGLGSPRSFRNHPICSPKSSQRNSDTDFHDVFGGPPRTSFTERREFMDSNLERGSIETSLSHNLRSGLSEKPVFGWESPRRKHLNNDFFDDIFDSSSSIPRRPDREILSSLPASRILSPTHPAPPNREPFVGALSLPAYLSQSSKLPKGSYLPMFCSPRHSPVRNKDIGSNGIGYSSSPIIGGSRVPSSTFGGQDELRSDIRTSRRCSHLSHDFSLSGNESAKAAEYDRQDKRGQFLDKKSGGNSEAYNESNQFHFSIYKWASKGVMLMMPAMRGNRSNAKERSKIIPVPVEKGVNFASPNNTTSISNNSSRIQCGGQDEVSSNGLNLASMNEENQEAVLAEARAKPSSNFDNDHTEGSEQANKVQSGGQEVHRGAEKEVQEPELKDLGSSNTAEAEVHKPELKTIGSLLVCTSDKPGKENIIEPTGQQDERLKNLSTENPGGSGKEKIPIGRKSVPKPIGRKPDLVQAEATKSNLFVAPLNSDYNMQGNRTKGKVKEFVKIFSQESSPKLTRDLDKTSHSSRRKESVLSKKEDTTNKGYRFAKVNNEDSNGTLTNTPSMVDQIPKLTANIQPIVKADDHKVCDSSSECNETSDSSPGSLNDALENIEDSHCEEFHVSCLLEQLPEDEKESLHLQPNQDDIQIIDAKIRQWSHAKEGNIRSLLSTLQYVVWPESGWKPVPLVDIIEGSSVRRAYQKALLCLHPDKLQQRGAAVHQKYIAEKVFDILQEAWMHFSSVSPI